MFDMLPAIIGIKKVHPSAIIPTYAKQGDAGADLYSCEDEKVNLPPGEVVAIRTGLALEIPEGFVGLVHPRSGLAKNFAITVANAPGTVDAGYRGEVLVLLINLGSAYYEVNPGDKIAQLVIQKVSRADFVEKEKLTASERGSGGFGSTGK